MSARSFNPDSDHEDGCQPQASNEGESCNESGTDIEHEEDVQPPQAKKKRAASEGLLSGQGWGWMAVWKRIWESGK